MAEIHGCREFDVSKRQVGWGMGMRIRRGGMGRMTISMDQGREKGNKVRIAGCQRSLIIETTEAHVLVSLVQFAHIARVRLRAPKSPSQASICPNPTNRRRSSAGPFAFASEFGCRP